MNAAFLFISAIFSGICVLFGMKSESSASSNCGLLSLQFVCLSLSLARYQVLELRGATMGIVGYGDIGRATARLAKAYGMKVLALSRKQSDATEDPYLDERMAPTELNRLFRESDYVFCALPLTPDTHGCIGEEQFQQAKPGCVFINVGRGPVVDEDALIRALDNGRLKGAALDVFTNEPLPTDSPLWNGLDNVLLSPHNMDFTATSQSESTAFFVGTQLPRFIRDLPLYNKVDPTAGY
jgi:phosphoglycerate dehydrogenase-like enzyme